MNWSDTPPTVAGTYWVRSRRTGRELTAEYFGLRWVTIGKDRDAAFMCRHYQFGQRIPKNAELSQIDRERAALCEVATICMNTRAIMPEFREIEDYTEVVDIIGAFLERLKELPGLIEGLRETLSLEVDYARRGIDKEAEKWHREQMEGLAEINAILGVAE